MVNNIDSTMLVQNKMSDDCTVITKVSVKDKILNKLRPTLDAIPVKFYKNKEDSLFSPSFLPFSSVIEMINDINPDIVHLHWVCHGMINVEDIARINVPIVWTLHDDWVFTGGCHIKWDCDKYQNNCGSCPRLGSINENDLSRKVFNRKKKAFSKIDQLIIVGVSHWLKDCAKKSALLKDKKIINLPNPLDTGKYKPFDKDKAKELWCLPKNKKLILFGANSATADINKGFIELCEALAKIKSTDVEFVVFGSSEPKKSQDFGVKTHYLGNVHDDVSLITIYSLADVMVVPSLQEAFGQTASEAMACGTPVVAFGHTGLLDIIDHKVNGYLAQPINTTDLANGIDWVLKSDQYDELCISARNKVVNEFDSKVVAKKYVELYKEILND
ncbi:glycosyltransferase family 4 protein [Colwellia sp. PAMC 21821]|uniref:glycosyltransferase family 4 protein n=1 Tax=Colwellia sp. PAMC 21821 TaxID=1816219 RepID=UPI00336A8E9D